MQSELFFVMGQHNEPLQKNLLFFLSSLQTLCDNTIEDTFLTIEGHNQVYNLFLLFKIIWVRFSFN
jgi:hypothetical protein